MSLYLSSLETLRALRDKFYFYAFYACCRAISYNLSDTVLKASCSISSDLSYIKELSIYFSKGGSSWYVFWYIEVRPGSKSTCFAIRLRNSPLCKKSKIRESSPRKFFFTTLNSPSLTSAMCVTGSPSLSTY